MYKNSLLDIQTQFETVVMKFMISELGIIVSRNIVAIIYLLLFFNFIDCFLSSVMQDSGRELNIEQTSRSTLEFPPFNMPVDFLRNSTIGI